MMVSRFVYQEGELRRRRRARVEEADFRPELHPRGRGGRWIRRDLHPSVRKDGRKWVPALIRSGREHVGKPPVWEGEPQRTQWEAANIARSEHATYPEKHPEAQSPGESGALTKDQVAAMYEGFEHQGFKVHVLTSVEYPTVIELKAEIRHGGRNVGEFQATYSKRTDEPSTIEHDWMVVNREYEGRGFSAAFHQHMYDQYRRNGIKQVTLQAVAVGGYAWAREGFDFDVDRYSLLASAMFGSELFGDETFARGYAMHKLWRERVWEGDFLSEIGNVDAMRQLDFLAKFPTHGEMERYAGGDKSALDGKWKSPMELATVGRDQTWTQEPGPEELAGGQPMWLGKRFLVGANWRGVKVLGLDVSVSEAEELLPSPAALARAAGEVRAERGLSLPPDPLDDDTPDFWDEVIRRAGAQA